MDGNSRRESLCMAKLNGRRYRSPARPVVVVCIDGPPPGYIQQGLKDGILPNIKGFMEAGFNAEADGVIPSFTNPNNLSILTGSPPVGLWHFGKFLPGFKNRGGGHDE